MKKIILASLVSTILSAPAAIAATGDTVNSDLIFKGRVTSVVPSGGITITGVGGGILAEGLLDVNASRQITTSKAITFEVREYTQPSDTGGTPGTGLGTIGDLVTTAYDIELLSIPALTVDGDNAIDNTHNKVFISEANGERVQMETGKAIARTTTPSASETVYFENLGNGDIVNGLVGEAGVGAGSGTEITATVSLLVTDKRPASNS